MALAPLAGVRGDAVAAAFIHHVTAGGAAIRAWDAVSALVSELGNMAVLGFFSLPQTKEPLFIRF